MKTFLTAILIVLSNVSSFAQIVAAEGFFDTDPGVGNGFELTVTPNGSVVDISSTLPGDISPGIHTLFVRTCSSSRLWSVARGRVVHIDQSVSMPPQVEEVDACEYFIGSDPGVGNGTAVPITVDASVASITENITSSLAPGFYRLSLRFRSTSGLWSTARANYFYVREEGDNLVADAIVEAEYFIDNTDPGVGNGIALNLTTDDPADVMEEVLSTQSPGIHSLNLRFKSNVGLWSVVRPRYFHVMDVEGDARAQEIVAAEYFVDSEPGVGAGIAVDLSNPGESIELAFEAMINAGFGTHILYLRTKSDRGLWSVPRGRAFVVTDDPIYPVNEIVYAEYFIDTDPGLGLANSLSIVQGSTVPLSGTVETTGFNPGEHTLFIRVLSNLGLWSIVSEQTFVIVSDDPVFALDEVLPQCADSDDGEISVEVFGGNSTYTYTWDGVIGTAVLTGASAGDHQLIVTDASNQVVLDTTITLIAPAPLSFESVVTPVSCYGLADGTATIIAMGGTGLSFVDWGGEDPNQLAGGDYTFTITDENACFIEGTVSISEPEVLDYTLEITNVSCNGENDGIVAVMVTGGTGNVSVEWGGEDPNQLVAGNYTFALEDENGCATSGNVTITEPAILQANSTVVPVSSADDCDGSITVAVTGGTAPYEYTWTPQAVNSNMLSDLCVGTYAVSVSDANGCSMDLANVLVTVGIMEQLSDSDWITVSPNPSAGPFGVVCSSVATTTLHWQVVDASGRIVQTSDRPMTILGKTNFTIDLSGLADGMYYLHMTLDQTTTTMPLVLTKL